jgi:hypothetical protein
VERVPFDDIANAAAFLLIEPPLGRRKMGFRLRPLPGVAAAEHKRIDLKKELEISHFEQIDTLGDQAVHKGISSHHIRYDSIIHTVAPRGEQLIYLWELRL